MDFSFSPEDEAFRRELRAWLSANIPPGLRQIVGVERDTPEQVATLKAWQRQTYDAGYVGLHWAREYGGRGFGIERQVIFHEEMARAQAPRLIGASAIELLGPTLIAYANEDLKRRYLPKMLRAEELWCQGFSEPNAGSDLASLQTRAEVDGDDFVINGQKIWTGGAHLADFCMLLCRTDPSVPKHRGISYLIVPMRAPGVTVQPIQTMAGHAEFNQVYFDDVRVPRSNLIGELNRGWYYAQNTLGFERGPITLSFYLGYRRSFNEVLDLARLLPRAGARALDDPVIRQEIASVYTDLEILRLNGYRMLTNILRGQLPGADVSPAKLHWSLTDQRLHALGMAIEGPFAQLPAASPRHAGTGNLQHDFLLSRRSTIMGGTAQIQRNITAERLLGLPR
jgi:alkylation response protein AidB-like acyl-CoA dehydrogenase